VKLAFFDVTDVENPKLIDSYEIGEAGSDSPALQDHKAFLFDKDKNVLVLPVREVKSGRIYNNRYGYYEQKVWQGAYIFSLDPNKGFTKKGTISHYDGDERSDYWWYSPYAVTRSLYMDNVLYTISAGKIKMNDLNNISDEINTVDIPYDANNWWPRPYY
jgi:inhibitor of cysteine peptidase